MKVRFHQSEHTVSSPAVTAVMDALGGKDNVNAPFLDRPRSITVAEVSGPMALADEDGLTMGFDSALEVLRTFQRSHHMVTTRPLSLVVRKSLPPVLPVMISGGEIFAKPEMSLFLVNQDEQHASRVRGPELPWEKLRGLTLAFNDYSPNLFSAFSDMRREGRLAYARGENLSAIILAGAAAEALLVEIMLLMMWEEDLDCTSVAKILDTKDTVTKKVTSQFAGRLGGQWNTRQPGPIRDWRVNLADLRNSAVHAGHFPDDRMIQGAFESLEALERYIGDRLVANMRKYSATTKIFLGDDGLARRGQILKFQEMVRQDNLYPPPAPGQYFRRWKQEVARIRAGRHVGCEENLELILVSYPNGLHRWFVQDSTNGLAAEVPPPVLNENLALTVSKLMSQVPSKPVSALIHGHRVTAGAVLRWQCIGELNPAHPYRRWEVCLIPPPARSAESSES
ncbi:hypothetical protein [Arthrobacter globiformis]|nr:hypothetical protein [Arthrobacter globiformis]